MSNAMVLTVGVGRDGAGRQSLAGALSYAIKNRCPDKVFFVCTAESASTIDSIEKKEKIMCKTELILLNDPDNIQSIFKTLLPRFKKIKSHYDNVLLDYTSGTKSMSAGAVLAAIMSGFDNLEVIQGERIGGIVAPQTEIITNFRMNFIKPEFALREAVSLFNAGRYDSCHQILEEIVWDDQELAKMKADLDRLALAYSSWDKFDHGKAAEYLNGLRFGKEYVDKEISKNKSFLGKLRNSKGAEVYKYMTVDLLNNAKRRAREGKYDDAVARLYRAIEGIAEYRLLVDGIDLNHIHQEDLFKSIKDCEKASKWSNNIDDGKLKIGLKEKFALLSDLGDSASELYLNDKELQNLLTKRNYSILAHGWKTVEKEDYDALYNKTESIARTIFEGLDSIMNDAVFVNIIL